MIPNDITPVCSVVVSLSWIHCSQVYSFIFQTLKENIYISNAGKTS